MFTFLCVNTKCQKRLKTDFVLYNLLTVSYFSKHIVIRDFNSHNKSFQMGQLFCLIGTALIQIIINIKLMIGNTEKYILRKYIPVN